MEGVFAGGDVVRGSDEAIWAIADGKNAAISIDRYLGGAGVLSTGEEIVVPEPADAFSWEKKPRHAMDALDLPRRKNSFSEVAKGFDKITAMAEYM
jgi:NADH-quinone oxidoreductase subunit F